MKTKVTIMWNSRLNTIAAFETKIGNLPYMEILDSDYCEKDNGYTYPMKYLTEHFGWIRICEL
jgi:hypothetical protein